MFVVIYLAARPSDELYSLSASLFSCIITLLDGARTASRTVYPCAHQTTTGGGFSESITKTSCRLAAQHFNSAADRSLWLATCQYTANAISLSLSLSFSSCMRVRQRIHVSLSVFVSVCVSVFDERSCERTGLCVVQAPTLFIARGAKGKQLSLYICYISLSLSFSLFSSAMRCFRLFYFGEMSPTD